MGDGSYSSSSSAARSATRAVTGATAFTYDKDVRAGKVSAMNPLLDITKKGMRESRDVPGKGDSFPIVIIQDVTESMAGILSDIVDNLHKSMGMIVNTKLFDDPQVCVTGVGDYRAGDRAPLQVCEFEADDELLEKAIGGIYLEQGGGGNSGESYNLALLALKLFKCDSWEKRQQKGIVIFICDEPIFLDTTFEEAQTVLGIDLTPFVPPITEENKHKIRHSIDTKYIYDQLKDQWDIICFRPEGGHEGSSATSSWESILGKQKVIRMKPEEVNVKIAATVASLAGQESDDIVAALKVAGFSATAASSAVKDLAPFTGNAIAKTIGDLIPGDSGKKLARL